MGARYKYFRRKQVWVFLRDKTCKNVHVLSLKNAHRFYLLLKNGGIWGYFREFGTPFKKYIFSEKRTTSFWEDVLLRDF